MAAPARAISPELERLLAPGLAYLAATEDELGVDVVVLIDVVADRTGSVTAHRVAELRRLRLGPGGMGPYENLFGAEKPVERVSLDGMGSPRIPTGERSGREPVLRVGPCLEEAARCDLTPRCRIAVADGRASGRGLTHQAAWLLFARWLECPVDLDLDRLGQDLVRRLRAEIESDSSYSETSLERLAMLGELGHADEISPLWWPTIVGAQGGEGCWGAEAGGRCHPHPTILALWALAHLDAARTRDTPAGR